MNHYKLFYVKILLEKATDAGHIAHKINQKTPTRLDPWEIWYLRLMYRFLNICD